MHDSNALVSHRLHHTAFVTPIYGPLCRAKDPFSLQSISHYFSISLSLYQAISLWNISEEFLYHQTIKNISDSHEIWYLLNSGWWAAHSLRPDWTRRRKGSKEMKRAKRTSRHVRFWWTSKLSIFYFYFYFSFFWLHSLVVKYCTLFTLHYIWAVCDVINLDLDSDFSYETRVKMFLFYETYFIACLRTHLQ